MNEEEARTFLEENKYQIDSLHFIPEGISHDIFQATLSGGKEMIARFEKKNQVVDGQRRDFHFNSPLSLEREEYLCTLVKKAGLPAPSIYDIKEFSGRRCLIVEKLPGIPWKDYQQNSGFSQGSFLSSLEYLAQDLATAHQITFETYGNIMPEGIEPVGIRTFKERLGQLINLKLGREQRAKALSEGERAEVHAYFRKGLEKISEDRRNPALIITDLHPSNFLVDASGKPSGYPDLEYCQAAVPALEFYFIKLQLFNYYDAATMNTAQEAFFKAYNSAGGNYPPEEPCNVEIEKLLSVGQILTAVTGYHQVQDGLRDTWSEQFKDILFSAMSTGNVDYVAYSDIIRMKTKQPKQPSL